MASLQELDQNSHLKEMLKLFRVQELKVLLSFANLSQGGRKGDLLKKVYHLIDSPPEGWKISITNKITELYNKRCSCCFHPKDHNINPTLAPDCSASCKELKSSVQETACPSAPSVVVPFDTNKDREAQVRFKPLPFFHHISSILYPVALRAKLGLVIQAEIFQVYLTHRQLTLINRDPNIQIQLRFCLLDPSAEQDDTVPPSLSVKINKSLLMIGCKSTSPINITSNCRSLQEIILNIRWSSEIGLANSSDYALSINLVEKLTVDKMTAILQQSSTIPSSTSKGFVREKLLEDQDSEIATTSLKVSLLCPLAKTRMKIPVRAFTCKHLQCFDAICFLCMNQRKQNWICPVCDKVAEFKNLVVDGLFVEILASCDSDEIQFSKDGSWHTTKKKNMVYVLDTPTKTTIDLTQADSTADDSDESTSKGAKLVENSKENLQKTTSEIERSGTQADVSKNAHGDKVYSIFTKRKRHLKKLNNRLQNSKNLNTNDVIDLTTCSDDDVVRDKASLAPFIMSDTAMLPQQIFFNQPQRSFDTPNA